MLKELKKSRLSLYCHFEDDSAMNTWMKANVIPNDVPHGGPIFCWAAEDESSFRDDRENLAAHLKSTTDILEILHAKSEHDDTRKMLGRIIVSNRDALTKAGAA